MYKKIKKFKKVYLKIVKFSFVFLMIASLAYNPSSPVSNIPQAHAAVKTIVLNYNQTILTEGTSWTVPDDWVNGNNTIEVIGGGGAGWTNTAATATGSGGGGGGGYSKITNLTLTPGATVTYQIGAGGKYGAVNGGVTFFNRTAGTAGTCADTVSVCANGGGGATSATGGAFADTVAAVGTTKWAGGAGGNGGPATALTGGGGGGAGGPTKQGQAGGNGYQTATAGTGGGGGGGNGGTSSTAGVTGTTAGGAGGVGDAGAAGGAGGSTAAGANGTGSGAGGGGADGALTGGNGANGNFAAYGGVGPGGGGGGSGTKSVALGMGGNGGLYGAGGGGGRFGGRGAPGVIIITNNGVTPTKTSWTVPVDWDNAANTVEVIGGGASSWSAIVGTGKSGGGGGAYSKTTNITLSPGGTVTYQIGEGGRKTGIFATPGIAGVNGGDTFFNRTAGVAGTCADTVSVCAKGGVKGASTTVGGLGGASASGVGTTKWSGGAGGTGNTTGNSGGGGGGAGGTIQNGLVGGAGYTATTGGGGGGGGAGDNSGANSTAGGAGVAANGGAGGQGPLGTGSGSAGANTFGGAGTAGTGGGGGGGDAVVAAGNFQNQGGDGGSGGGSATTYGGGGGGGVGDDAATTTASDFGGDGGLFGAGGGGGLQPGFGANGAIIITYTQSIKPTLSSNTATSILVSTATLGANLRYQGDSAITARGTCWGTSPAPVTNCLAEGGTGTGAFTQARTGLPANTLIYYRGYATNANGNTGYSIDSTFNTLNYLNISLGKTTDGWSGAVPVYATLAEINNTTYPYARAHVTTIAGATFDVPMTWSAGNSRFEGVIYPGSNICMGCEDPKTYNGSFSTVIQLDDNAGFPSINYTSSASTFTIFMTTKRSSMDAVAATNYTDFNSIWTTDHWHTTINDFGFAMRTGSGTNVAVAVPIHPVTSSPSNFTVAFNGASVSAGTAASTGVNAWWYESSSHTLYVQFASLTTTLVDVDIAFDTDTDLFATRYNWTQTFDMGQRSGSNGLYIANRYLTTFIYPIPPSLADNNLAPVSANEAEQAGIQAESRAHLDGGADQSTDCMERVAVHVDGVALADTSTNAYDKDIKWKLNEYANWITAESNTGFTLVQHSDDTAVSGTTGGWAQQLSNGITATRTQNYYAGKRYIKNTYDFYNGGASTRSYPMVWEREQWHGTDRQVNDAGRFANNPGSDVVMEQRVSPAGWAKFWQTAYDKVTFINGGMIWDKDNLPDFGIFAVEPFLGGTTPFYEWPIVITASHATQTTDQTGFEKTWSSVAPGATVSFTFYHEHNAETSWANIQASMDADEAEINAAAPPALTQASYRWRNDSGNEINASYAVNENTPLTSGVYVGEKRRLRVAVANTGTSTATNMTYRLEYSSGACASWNQVPAVGDNSGPWVMATSSNVTDGSATTDSSGITNPQGDSFLAGKVMTNTSQTAALTLTSAQFTELEYSLTPTSNVVTGTKYCFRVTNAGVTTGFTYAAQPEIYAANLPFIARTGGGSAEAPSQAPGAAVGGGGGGGTGGSGGSTTAGGIAVIQFNSVQSVTMTSGGSYLAPPSVSFCGGGGSGAAGAANLLEGGDTVIGVTILNGGTGYTSPPTVVFGGSCGGAGGGSGGSSGGDSGFLYSQNNLATASASDFKFWDMLKYLFSVF